MIINNRVHQAPPMGSLLPLYQCPPTIATARSLLMPSITPSSTDAVVDGMRRLQIKLVLLIIIRIWYSPLNTLSFWVWKAGSYLEPRRVLLLIQTFIDEPVGLGLKMCLMFNHASQKKHHYFAPRLHFPGFVAFDSQELWYHLTLFQFCSFSNVRFLHVRPTFLRWISQRTQLHFTDNGREWPWAMSFLPLELWLWTVVRNVMEGQETGPVWWGNSYTKEKKIEDCLQALPRHLLFIQMLHLLCMQYMCVWGYRMIWRTKQSGVIAWFSIYMLLFYWSRIVPGGF